MSRMPEHLRTAYTVEMTAARHIGDDTRRWHHLERAHIIPQPYPWPRTHNHVAMLGLALRQRDRREALGQIIRINVPPQVPLLGRYPAGNTGRRTHAGLTTPMPMPADLADALSRNA